MRLTFRKHLITYRSYFTDCSSIFFTKHFISIRFKHLKSKSSRYLLFIRIFATAKQVANILNVHNDESDPRTCKQITRVSPREQLMMGITRLVTK